MTEMQKWVKVRFIGYKQDGTLMKGAPGNYKPGEIYIQPFDMSKLPYWELVAPTVEPDIPETRSQDEGDVQKKINVLSIVDTYGWAWDIASKELFSNLPEKYVGHILDKNDFLSQKPNTSFFDVILVYPFTDSRVIAQLNTRNTIICIAGWEDLEKKLIWAPLQRFKYFGACNKKIAELIRKTLPNKTIWILNHGVDTNRFKPIEEKPKGFIVGWVGNQFRKIKRLPLAQESVAKVNGAELRIAGLVGSPIYRSHEKMPEFYQTISCLLVTSSTEAHSLVVYEAMSSGLPVISTCTGDTDENIVNGVNGFLLPVNCSVDQIVPILVKLRDDPSLRERIGNAARQTVLEKWMWSKVAESYINAFKGVSIRA